MFSANNSSYTGVRRASRSIRPRGRCQEKPRVWSRWSSRTSPCRCCGLACIQCVSPRKCWAQHRAMSRKLREEECGAHGVRQASDALFAADQSHVKKVNANIKCKVLRVAVHSVIGNRQWFKTTNSLRRVSLRRQESDAGSTHRGSCEASSTLTTLGLHRNSFGDAGAVALADAAMGGRPVPRRVQPEHGDKTRRVRAPCQRLGRHERHRAVQSRLYMDAGAKISCEGRQLSLDRLAFRATDLRLHGGSQRKGLHDLRLAVSGALRKANEGFPSKMYNLRHRFRFSLSPSPTSH